MKKKLPVNIDDLGLTPREIKFVGEYITNGYRAEDAAKEANLLNKDAGTAASRIYCAQLLSDTRVKEAIKRTQDSFIEPYRDIHYAKIQEILEVRATYDIADYRYANGRFKPLDEISPKLRYAIDDMKERWFMGKNGQNESTVEYTMADRKDALKQLRELHEQKKSDDGPNNGQARAELINLVEMLKNGVAIGRKMPVAEVEASQAEPVPPMAASDLAKQIKNGEYLVER